MFLSSSLLYIFLYLCGLCVDSIQFLDVSLSLFAGADLKIGTKEKPIKVRSQLRIGDVFIMNVMRISHATPPASAVKIGIVPDLRACACVCAHITQRTSTRDPFRFDVKKSFIQTNEKENHKRKSRFSGLYIEAIFEENANLKK